MGFALDEDEVLDDGSWDHYQRYWRDLVDGLFVSIGQAGEWPTWEPTTYGDHVTPMPRMYRSICDGRSARLDRAFSIQQYRTEPDDTDPYILAVVKDYFTELQDFPDIKTADAADDWFERVAPGERVPRAGLDIILVHSDAAVAAVRSLLSTWARPETTPEKMRAAIRAMPDVDGY